MMNIAFPFHIAKHGRVAVVDYPEHIYEMIEQILFTAPGERVNRPTFGCGLMQYVFAPMNNEMTTATQFLVQGALQQWLGNLIQVEGVQVTTNEEDELLIVVQYVIRSNGQRKVDRFAR